MLADVFGLTTRILMTSASARAAYRAMNRPRPGRAVTAPSRHTTSPRDIVTTGHPLTRIPSNAV